MAIGNHGKIGSTVMFHVVGALRLEKGFVLSLFMEVRPAQDQMKTRETATLIHVQVRSTFYCYDASSRCTRSFMFQAKIISAFKKLFFRFIVFKLLQCYVLFEITCGIIG